MGKHDGERFGRLVVLETWRRKRRCLWNCTLQIQEATPDRKFLV